MGNEKNLLGIVGKAPDWRRARAAVLAAENLHRKKMLFNKGDDAVVRELAQYLKDVERGSPVSLAEVAKRNLPLREAWLLWGETTSTSRKHALEAVMMAEGMTDDEAATLAAVPKEVARWYFNCFFDLREKGDKDRYISSMHLYLRAYRHSLLESVGYKYIVSRGGLDRFKRLILERCATREDRDWLQDDEINLKTLYEWSHTWASMGGDNVNPLELQRREFMNPRRAVAEKPKGSGEEQTADYREIVTFTMKAAGPVEFVKKDA